MVPIRKEGSPYIIAVAVVATLTSLISVIYPFTALRISVLICWVAFIFCVNFFRDPERETPVDVSNIISPADGTIIDIRRVTEKGDPAYKDTDS